MGFPEGTIVKGKEKFKTGKQPGTAQVLQFLNRTSGRLNKGLAGISGCSLLLAMFVVVFNGISRVVHVPFPGTTEIVGWLGGISTAFALGYTQMNNGHVDIDILVQKFPASFQHILKALVLTVSAVFFALVSWQVIIFGLNVAGAGNVSETLGWPFYPLIFLMALGFMGFTAVLLVELLNHILGRAEQ